MEDSSSINESGLSVTVLVPVHNGAAHLCETVDALLAQTFTEFELLCIDDGSTDNSFELLASYRDSRLRVLRQAQAGLSNTLNRGISEARGIFIARNDQDDISLPHRLERQLDFFKSHPDVDCLFSKYIKAGAKKARAENYRPGTPQALILEVGRSQIPQHGSSMMARRTVLQASGGYRQDYYPADDWDLQLRLVEKYDVRLLEESLVIYRYHLGANTYPTFQRMMQNGRWAFQNHQLRLAHRGEISREQFLRGERESPILQRLRHRLYGLARLNMRKASQADLDGSPISAALFATLAALCDPAYVIRRAWFNIGQWGK